MAVSKFIRAQDILKEKGFKAPPFDTAAFQNAVVEFFRENDMSAKLTIKTMRFLDYKNAPKNPLFISTVPVVTHYVINEEEREEEEDSWGEMIKYYTVNIERIENGEKTVSRSCISEEDLDCEHPRKWDEYKYPYPQFLHDVVGGSGSTDSPLSSSTSHTPPTPSVFSRCSASLSRANGIHGLDVIKRPYITSTPSPSSNPSLHTVATH